MKYCRINFSPGIHRPESLLNTQSSNGKHRKINMALRCRKGNGAEENLLMTPRRFSIWRGAGRNPGGQICPFWTLAVHFGLVYNLSSENHSRGLCLTKSWLENRMKMSWMLTLISDGIKKKKSQGASNHWGPQAMLRVAWSQLIKTQTNEIWTKRNSGTLYPGERLDTSLGKGSSKGL